MAALLLRVEDAADQLGLSRSKCYDLIADGTLPSVRLGPRCVRVPAAWLGKWVEQHEPAHRQEDTHAR
jgi:excisionase family DNA binding protein